MTTVYDKAKWHFGGDYPKDLPVEQAYVHTGMFYGWLVDQKLLSQWAEDDFSDDIDKFRQRTITGPKLYAVFDGVLADDMLNDEGNEFAGFYYEGKEKLNFLDDYSGLFGKDQPSLYHVDDTWENYEKLKQLVDERYGEWKRTRGAQPFARPLTKTAATNEVLERLVEPLAKHGFSYLKSKQAFSRKKEPFRARISFHVIDWDHFEIEIWVGLRSEQIETVHKKFHPATKSDSLTVYKRLCDANAELIRVKVQTDQDLDNAAQQLLENIEQYAFPFFEQYKSIAAIDEAINLDPLSVCKVCNHDQTRARLGVITATLIGRADLDELVRKYRQELGRIHKDFLAEFDDFLNQYGVKH